MNATNIKEAMQCGSGFRIDNEDGNGFEVFDSIEELQSKYTLTGYVVRKYGALFFIVVPIQ